MAQCRHANSVPYHKSKKWTPLPKHHATPPPPHKYCGLTPPPPKLPSYVYVVFVLMLPEPFELDLSLSSIGFVVVVSLNNFPYYNTSLNFYKKAWFIFQTLTGRLISMHLQYNSSRNREYTLILQFVIIIYNTDRPLMSFGIVRLLHVT